ncbi:sensor histidine kinase [Micromonospora qiuiae]|nr:sensor histidine kinase [Micromonospora qiuiae]
MTAVAPPSWMRWLSRAGPFLADVLLAAAVAALGWYAALETPAPTAGGLHEPPWQSTLTGLALGAPVVLRRYRPWIATAVVLVVTAFALATGIIPDYAVAAPLVAVGAVLYSVAATQSTRRSAAALAGCIGVITVVVLSVARSPFGPASPSTGGESYGVLGGVFVALVLGAAWAIGWAVRERRAWARRAAEQVTEQAVQDERLRIAREVHDIAAHGMGLIAVQAAVANHVAEQHPQQAQESLRVIESTSRAALVELRRVLGTLRPEPDLEPVPGLADLPALVERTRSAGVPVDFAVHGTSTPPEGVELSVFRIVQESLTNVVKHAGPARCRVDVALAPNEVRVEVHDDGRQPAGTPARYGQGLVGMRERVAIYQGEFRAGPDDAGGWTVRATLPLGRTG